VLLKTGVSAVASATGSWASAVEYCVADLQLLQRQRRLALSRPRENVTTFLTDVSAPVLSPR
jgi:hypothetical protein